MVDITAAEVFRDFVTDGVPSSGAHNPRKPDIRKLLKQYETIIAAFTASGGVIYASKAALDADLARPENTMAWVLGDGVAANNGIYRKVGTSGAGNWVRAGDLPYSFILASNVGAGTPSAIQATTAIPVSGSALILLQIAEDYAGVAATVSFNGAAPLAIKTNSGEDVRNLAGGSVVYGVISGGVFRLANDEAIASLIYEARDEAVAAADRADAEADRSHDEADRSEAARDIAAGYASDAVSQGNVPIYATVVGMPSLEIPVGINAIRVNGYYAAGDGGGALYVKVDDEPTHAGKFQTADGAWWEIAKGQDTRIEMFGAVSGNAIDASKINNASDFLTATNGGGLIVYPSGQFLVNGIIIVDDSIEHRPVADWATVLEIPPGANTDVFVSRDFDLYSGQATLPSAPPKGFSVIGFEIQGNYLDMSSDDWRTANTILNSSGSAVKLYGYEFRVDIMAYNVAEHALWCEGRSVGFESNREHVAQISVGGRIFGKEGFVMKGPGDSQIISCGMGLAGLLPATARVTATENPSALFPGYGIAGAVIDNAGGSEGHCEVDFMHNYGCFYGYGILALGVNRVNARHMAVDNCLGGFAAPDSAHGLLGMLEVRACGRKPDGYTGSSIAPLPDILINNGQIFQLTGQMRVSKYGGSTIESATVPSIQVSGNNNNLSASYHSDLSEDLDPYQVSRALSVTGDNNAIRFDGKRIKGTGVYVSGKGNNISGSMDGVWGVALHRDHGGGNAYANTISLSAINIQATGTAFQSTGTPPSEKISLMASGQSGYTPFSGDAPVVLSRGQMWDIAATVGNSVVGPKMTADYVEGSLDISDATEKTLVLDHQMLYTPHRSQISYSLFHAATTEPNSLLEFLYISAISATQITFKYKWQAAPTTGSAPTLAVSIR
ncbi:hypothetical protein [Agrobacterium pusense]|uniref:hypothetical protein n=1 Tax=Agrobacterium pusense TaxID=648995 RepID=UPI000EC9FB8B|nr:hypothetical protein [Agrobacterium sp.]